jgi:hypothetical protein
MSSADPFRVPAKMRVRYDQIVALTDVFAREHLNEDYVELCRRMAAALARKRPSPLDKGQAHVWAAGIVYTVGWVNFLADPSHQPHLPTARLAELLEVGQSTLSAKLGEIRKVLGLVRLHPEWTLRSMLMENPLVWFADVNGVPVDLRQAPRELQQAAFEQGVIPFIPETSVEWDEETLQAVLDNEDGRGQRRGAAPDGSRRRSRSASGGNQASGASAGRSSKDCPDDALYQLKITVPKTWTTVP